MTESQELRDIPRPVIEARDVRVVLQGNEILHGVTMEAHPGEVLAVLGGNGSGKSTLLRAIVGAIPPASGSIAYFGSPATAAARARIGYVPQRLTATGGVAATALELVTSGLLGHRRLRPPRDANKRALAALETMGVANLARRDVSTLSGGQQQRVLIARALIRKPEVLLLDEPMAGVDLQSQVAFAHAIGHLKEDGVAVIIVLHELGSLARLIDKALVLDAGCVTHFGTPPKDAGVHALPGHDHEHPHTDPATPGHATLGWEGP